MRVPAMRAGADNGRFERAGARNYAVCGETGSQPQDDRIIMVPATTTWTAFSLEPDVRPRSC